ncbi:MAG: metallophosphoesterase [Gammaproteobacteria bacterium]
MAKYTHCTRVISAPRRLARSVVLAICAACAGAAWADAPTQWRWSNVDSVVAVADVHGDYEALVTMLRQAGVVGDDLGWTDERTHLVVVGDVLDRGPDSRRVLDLLMRLEPLADAAGGRVHMTLGNHEVMNLTGDLRYVSTDEFMAFADDTSRGERDRWFERFVIDHPEFANTARARKEFDQRYPQGFFGHLAAFSPGGAYGAWLLKQPLLVVINETAFVHGGLSSATAKLGGDGINGELRAQILEYAELLHRFRTAGVLPPDVNFYDHPQALDRYAQRVRAGKAVWPDDMSSAADRLAALNTALVFEQESPLWYRGTVSCGALIEEQRLMNALAAMPADRVVVGHTPTPGARVLSRMDGRVLRIDTGMLNAHYGGRGAALMLEGDSVEVLYEDQSPAAQPVPQPRRVGSRPQDMTADDLEALLRDGEIVDKTSKKRETLLTLQKGDVRVQAVFDRARRSKSGFYPDVAAYRLDRALGLNMVPVAVVREVDGKAGSVRFAPQRTMTEAARLASRKGGSALCPVSDQFQAMYVFDSLVFNEGRSKDNLLYDVNNWQAILVGHERAFGTRRGRPAYLADVKLSLNDLWIERLNAMDRASLEQTMQGVLDGKRIDALLARRDELLEGRARDDQPPSDNAPR